MTDAEIDEIVSALLRKRFADIGFERSSVQTEEDFDGSSVIRVTAQFNNGDLPSERVAERLIDARHEIRSELMRRGDERFVFLNSVFPHDHDQVIDDDLE
jgi:hypothetical protein